MDVRYFEILYEFNIAVQKTLKPKSQMTLDSSQGTISFQCTSKMILTKIKPLTFAVALDLVGGVTIETR